MELTEADIRLLRLIQKDARLSNAELAERAGLSTSVCWRRVKALQDAGVITGYPAVLDEEKVGMNFSAILHVSLKSHEASVVSTFLRRISDRPDVLTCFVTTGEADYVLRVLCRDKDAYNLFLDEFLLRIPGIDRVRTNLVLKTIKLQSEIPL